MGDSRAVLRPRRWGVRGEPARGGSQVDAIDGWGVMALAVWRGRVAVSDIFLGRAGGSVARQLGRAIGDVHAVRRAAITVERTAPRKRLDVPGYLTVEAEAPASEPGEVACGIPGFYHPGTELENDLARSADPALRWGSSRPRRLLHQRLRLLERLSDSAAFAASGWGRRR